MKMPKSAIVTSSLILVLLPDLLQARTTPGSQDALKSVRKFVQDFYSWCFPNALKFEDPVDLALRDRAYVFSPELVAQVERRNGHWVFTNFLYPSVDTQFGYTPNLLEYLKLLREHRRGEKPDTRAK